LFSAVFAFLYFRKSGYRESFGVDEPMTLDDREDWEDITDSLDMPYEAIVGNGIRVFVTEGGGVYATDDEENIIWTNVSQDYENAFTGDTNLLSSPFYVEYNYAREQRSRLYTLQEAVDREQYKVYLNDNKIITEYILGECGNMFLLPQAIPQERFENEILPNLDETDASYLTRRYTLYTKDTLPVENKEKILKLAPGIQDHPLYILTDGSSIRKKERTAKIIQDSSYTEEQFEEDRKITLEKLMEFKEVFHVSVVYYLDGNDLIVRIPCDQIEFYADNPLLSIGFAPYGCYGVSEDKGYYLLPVNSGVIDGLGGVYDSTYKINLMGSDLVQSVGKDMSADYAPFPVYGMVRNGKGFLAIIEEGAEITTLNYDKTKGASSLYPSFRLLEQANVSIVTNKQSSVYGKDAYNGNITIRYHFSEKETANYSSMADYYREYLLKRQILKADPEDTSFLLEVIGNVTVKDTVAGLIPVKTVIPLTTFEQCDQIVSHLKERNLKDYSLKLSGFNKHGLFGQNPGEYVFEKKLGNTKARNSFLQKMKEDGTDLYLDVNIGFYYANHGFSGYSPRKTDARFPSNNIAKLPIRKVPSDLPLESAYEIHIVSPLHYPAITKKYAGSLDDVFNVSIGDTALFLNTDFNMKNYFSRTSAISQLNNSLTNLERRKIMGKSPAAYLLSNLSLVEDLKMENSISYDFESEIPFVQMVLHGSLNYTSVPINSASDHQKALLKIIETGSTPKYRIAYELDNKIVNTEYNYLYNISYSEWKDTMISDLEYIGKALGGLEERLIEKHEIIGELRKITYDDGTVLYVNYGNSDITVDGLTVKATSYLRI
jgi:hypothetical protein